MIRKLNSRAVKNTLSPFKDSYSAIVVALVKSGDYGAFLASPGTSIDKLGAYIRRRLPDMWRDYVAVEPSPSYADFLSRSETDAVVFPEVQTPEGTLWLIDYNA